MNNKKCGLIVQCTKCNRLAAAWYWETGDYLYDYCKHLNRSWQRISVEKFVNNGKRKAIWKNKMFSFPSLF